MWLGKVELCAIFVPFFVSVVDVTDIMSTAVLEDFEIEVESALLQSSINDHVSL